jgi:DNA-binding MarR family transcriptional regulator
VRNLKLLNQNGWIEPLPGEGRGLRHRLTPAGQAILEAAIPLWQQAQAQVESRLKDMEGDEARRAMRALRKASHSP